jgi:hypothetical protein
LFAVSQTNRLGLRDHNVVQPSEFRFTKREELVKFYNYPPDGRRAFCSVCGNKAPLQVRYQDTHVYLISAGSFDDDPVTRPILHLFVGSKAPWWEINDSLPPIREMGSGI